MYVILIKKHKNFLYSDQQGLKKLKTNKQLLWWLYHVWMNMYLALVGIYHHWGTSSGRVLAFCKTKLQVVFTIPHIGSKIYSNRGYNISHKSLFLVLVFATHKSIQLKMNSKVSCSKLRYKVVWQAFAKYYRATIHNLQLTLSSFIRAEFLLR